jgi:hypothetical protein
MPEFQEVQRGNLIRWDEPREVIGKFVSIEKVAGQFSEESTRVTLEQEDGTLVRFYAPAMLNSLFEDARPKPGDLLKVVYTGGFVRSKSGRPVKEFKLYIAR